MFFAGDVQVFKQCGGWNLLSRGASMLRFLEHNPCQCIRPNYCNLKMLLEITCFSMLRREPHFL
jgi:hypothetical protein